MTQIKLRRDTAANFTSKNPVLGVGEPAYETDTKKLKIGDGTTAYTQLEYFSTGGGGGSTNISAALPLKIVNGVISLEVDGQTIQIVDGKLHANLDELSNEVNTLAGDVASVQADLPKKQDGLVSASPIEIKKSTGLTVVGRPMSGNDFVMDRMSTTSYCLFPENYLAIGNEYQIKFTTPSSWPSDYSSIVDFYDPLGPQYDYTTGNISVWTNRDGAGFEPVIPSPTLNTTYYIRMKMVTSTRIKTCYSTDGKTFTGWKYTDINDNLPWSAQRHHVGTGYNPGTSEIVRVWTGTIDLKECYVIANGVKYYMFPDAKTGAIGINLGSGLTVTDGKLHANLDELNNPYSLFDSKYSDHKLNNLSWLKSEGQWNAKAVYTDAYDKLLKVYNGTETVEGLSVKLSTEDYTDYDFVLNTAEETFRLPLLDGSEDLPSDTVLKTVSDTNINTTETLTLFTASHNGFFTINIWGAGTGIGRTGFIHKNGVFMGCVGVDANSYDQGTVSFEVKRGDVIAIHIDGTPVTYNYNYLKAVGNGSLYFYVGETVQNANLIDAGRIGEVLATKTDMLQASGASMPSNKYINLTLGASGSTYTAPANGYFVLEKVACTSSTSSVNPKFIEAINQQTDFVDYSTANYQFACCVSCPAKKNETVYIGYDCTGNTLKFRFIYAEGSK